MSRDQFLNIVVTMSLGGFFIHGFFGNPWAAATHLGIGLVALLALGREQDL